MSESAFERWFYSVATRNLGEEEIAGYRASVEKHESLSTASAFPAIDAKATGLLTHVSMMIAGLGLVAPLVASSDLELGIIIVEMAAYLLIAIGTLRCMSVFAGNEMLGDDLDKRIRSRIGHSPRTLHSLPSRHDHPYPDRVRAAAVPVFLRSAE